MVRYVEKASESYKKHFTLLWIKSTGGLHPSNLEEPARLIIYAQLKSHWLGAFIFLAHAGLYDIYRLLFTGPWHFQRGAVLVVYFRKQYVFSLQPIRKIYKKSCNTLKSSDMESIVRPMCYTGYPPPPPQEKRGTFDLIFEYRPIAVFISSDKTLSSEKNDIYQDHWN